MEWTVNIPTQKFAWKSFYPPLSQAPISLQNEIMLKTWKNVRNCNNGEAKIENRKENIKIEF